MNSVRARGGSKAADEIEIPLANEDGLSLREFTLCVNRSSTGMCSIEMTRRFWEDIDSFIRDHRSMEERQVGLTAAAQGLSKIDDFINRCETMSLLLRDLFVDPGAAGLQRREFFRAMHHEIEECLIGLSSLHPERGLSEAGIRQAIGYAHVMRTGIGHVLVQMESFEGQSAE